MRTLRAYGLGVALISFNIVILLQGPSGGQAGATVARRDCRLAKFRDRERCAGAAVEHRNDPANREGGRSAPDSPGIWTRTVGSTIAGITALVSTGKIELQGTTKARLSQRTELEAE